MTRKSLLILAALTLLNLLVFGRMLGHSFLAYDDGQFVYENPQVRKGLTGESVRWALTSGELGYYPVTWLSHMLDVELHGLAPAGHFASALLFHILATAAVFIALSALTGEPGKSALVAALFAVHPMHVESVAWISERRDTLSTLFGMLALAAYARFARNRSARLGVLVAIALAASLLSKQMLVTLPFLLLVLDYWPLGRRDWNRAVLEKIPFFAIALAGAALALAGQNKLEAVQSTAAVPLSLRLGNAIVAYARYLGKLFWPADLAVLYPFETVSTAALLGSGILLAVITTAAILLRRRAPYFLAGWLWFLGTLIPVIGIVKIGLQSMADRYSYVPYVGLFIALVWGAGDLARRVPQRALAASAVAVVALLAALAWRQTELWTNTETLFTHTLAVTGPNPAAEYTLGQTLQLREPDRALTYFRHAISEIEAIPPASRVGIPLETYAQSHVGSGTALLMKARAASRTDRDAAVRLVSEAESAYRRAIEIDPQHSDNARRNLLLAATMKQQLAPPPPPPAPGNAEADSLIDRGLRHMNANELDAAIPLFRRAVELEPRSTAWRIYLALAYMKAGRNAAAVEQFEEAKRLDPVKANGYVTKALRMSPFEGNLDAVIARLK